LNNNIFNKVCKKCNKEYPATLEFFHTNKKNGVTFLYSVCKDCKRKNYEKKSRVTKQCEFCGREFESRRSDKKFCSRNCQNRKLNGIVNFRKGKEPRKCVHCKLNKVEGKNKYCEECKSLTVTKYCPRCNKEFVSGKFNRIKFCSDNCRKKDSIRKKKIFDEANNTYLTRDEVFKLENYKCKNCGCTTDKKLSYVKDTLIIKPTAPTIDHIIPLNKGGTHTLRNIQLLCFKCNHDKQDGYLEQGEQLKMF
jgi:hypothetical protein